MQQGKRAIIVGVDNRAKDIQINYNLNYLDRNEFNGLSEIVNSVIETQVRINEKGIRTFLSQFNYDEK